MRWPPSERAEEGPHEIGEKKTMAAWPFHEPEKLLEVKRGTRDPAYWILPKHWENKVDNETQ